MLKTRKLFLIVVRQFSDNRKIFSSDVLCSVENRTKCVERMKLAAKYTTLKTTKEPKSFAAVLVPLVQADKNNDEPSILYTLRSNKLRRHIRQVSFPGGIRDGNDVSYTKTALRETEEEIGITSNQINVWGEANLFLPLKGPAIMPVVAQIENYRSDQLKLNADEVERVFTVPISKLCANKRHTQFRGSFFSKSGTTSRGYSVPVFTVDENPIWGITAVITHLFLSSLLPDDAYQRQIPYISKYK